MIIRLSSAAEPALTDLDRLDRLHAECDGPLTDMRSSDLCDRDDDGAHVWLHVATARAIGVDAAGDDFGTRFDGMIAYATSKGWLNEAGTHVRAHVQD